jgi:hypothetical protein
MIYPALRDSDTTDEEAEDYIREELISIMPSYETKDPDFYNRYLNDDEFRNSLVDYLIDRTYEDYSISNDIFNKENKENRQLFEKMKKIVLPIAIGLLMITMLCLLFQVSVLVLSILTLAAFLLELLWVKKDSKRNDSLDFIILVLILIIVYEIIV